MVSNEVLSKIIEELGNHIRLSDCVLDDYYDCVCIDYCPCGWQLYTGASKAVFTNEEFDMVLKVPIHGYIYNGSEYQYYNACDEEPWDYCFDELKKYEQAKEDGFANFFPYTKFIEEDCNGIRYYAQEKVEPFGKIFKDMEAEDRENTKKILEKILDEIEVDDYPNLFFTQKCIDFYGYEKTKKFFEYIYIRYPEIGSDLYSRNLGFRKNGEPVILDFSGFRDYD